MPGGRDKVPSEKELLQSIEPAWYVLRLQHVPRKLLQPTKILGGSICKNIRRNEQYNNYRTMQ